MKEFLKKTEDEVAKHVLAIDRIAASLHIPREEVRRLYERVLAELQDVWSIAGHVVRILVRSLHHN